MRFRHPRELANPEIDDIFQVSTGADNATDGCQRALTENSGFDVNKNRFIGHGC